MHRGAWTMRGWVLGAVWLGVAPAEAANRRSFYFGGEAAMTGAALTGQAEGTDALFYNPAGLASQFNTGLNLSMTAFTLRASPLNDGFIVDYPDGAQASEVPISEFLPVPSALVFARNLGERLGYGLGIFVVETRDVRFASRQDRTGVPLPESMETLQTTSGLDGQRVRKTYNIGGGLGWQATSKLRLGWSLYAVYDRRVEATQYFSAATVESDTPVQTNFTASESSDIKSLALVAGFGLQYRVSEQWSFGLLFKSPTFSLYSWGDEGETISNPGENGQVLLAERESISEFNVQVVDPTSLELMGHVRLGKWEIGATFEIVPAIEQGGIIPLSADFLWNLRVGAQVDLNETLRFGFGFQTDRSPNRNVEGPLDTAIDYYGLTSGIRYARYLNERKTVSFTTAVSLSYMLGLGEIAAFTLDPLATALDVGFTPVDATFHEVAVNLASGIRF